MIVEVEMVSETDGLAEEIVWLLGVSDLRLGVEGLVPRGRGVGNGGGRAAQGPARARAPVAVATSRGLIRVNPVSRHQLHRCNNRKGSVRAVL